MNFPLRKLAAAIALSVCCSHSLAQNMNSSADDNNAKVASVVIIGSRFPSTSDFSPIGATVITATEIQNAGIDNANEAIRKLAGVYGRQNLSGTQDFNLDISGFGADSANNLVVLVDGVRLSENEQAIALLSSIPIDSIARIEIMRGGSSVLYGDGATGGVIQIITKQPGAAPLHGSLTAELGQFRDRAGRVWLSKGWDQFTVSLNLNDQKSDNYRDNNALSQQNVSGAMTWYIDQGRTGLRVDSARQKSRLPGALSLAQFNQNPRQSVKPNDNSAIATDRITAFVEQTWGEWQAAAELSTREKTVKSNFPSLQSFSTYSGNQTEFTPRVRHVTQLFGLQNELVIGIDAMNWNRTTDSNYSLTDATQRSKAIYVRHEINADKLRFAAGTRRELFDKTSVDPFPGSVDNYTVVQGVNAWEVQGSYAFDPVINAFARWGQSYRVANVDDNAFTAQPNTPLSPQISHDVELGTMLGDVHHQFSVRYFRHQITNEIYFDPLVNNGNGANSNLDPTKRAGVAIDVKYRLSHQFHVAAQAQQVNAVFTDGINAGKQLALVPKNTAFIHMNWTSGDGQRAYVAAQWVDRQRYGGDFTNACPLLIPSHTTIDARYANAIGDWEWAVMGLNLTNKQYFTSAFGCASGIYPNSGRQLKATLRYSF